MERSNLTPSSSDRGTPRLLFMALGYPHADADGTVYTDLAIALARWGADVRVVAPASSDGFTGVRSEQGVTVLRAHVDEFQNVGRVRKALTYLSLPRRFGRTLRRFGGEWTPDWLVVYTPPVTLAPLVSQLKRRLRCRTYLILHDLFPRNAVDLGLFRAGGVRHAAFGALERWYYAASDTIGFMSPEHGRAITSLHPWLDRDRLVEFPLWISRHAVVEPADRELRRREERSRLGLGDDDVFVVLGGNLGVPQRSDVIVDLAMRTRDRSNLSYCVVGDGTERERLVAKIDAARREGARVRWLPRMPRHDFQSFLAAADVGLVTLSERFTVPNIPSRTLGYAAAGVPVCAITDRCTDLFDAYLRPYGLGAWAPMDDVDQATATLLDLVDRPDVRRAMGAAGRQAVLGSFTADRAAARLLAQLGEGRREPFFVPPQDVARTSV